jgi:hypothetical protein
MMLLKDCWEGYSNISGGIFGGLVRRGWILLDASVVSVDFILSTAASNSLF